MRVPAAILLTMLIATPAMAIDIVSGSGAVVKNGAGLTVVNGDSCSGQMDAACFDRESDRAERRSDVTPDVGGAGDLDNTDIVCRYESPGCE